jgi:hypothetical protein
MGILNIITYIPLAGALLILLAVNRSNVRAVRMIATGTVVIDFLVSLWLWPNFDRAATGAKMWQSQSLGYTYVGGMLAADVGAPGRDLVVVSGNVIRFRWSDKQQTSSANNDYTYVVPMDVTGTPELELVAARTNGSFDVLDGETLQVLSTTAPACFDPPYAAPQPIGPMVALGTNTIAYVCADALNVYDLAGQTVIDSEETGLIWLGASGSLVRSVIDGKPALFTGGDTSVLFVDVSGNHIPVVPPQGVSLHWRASADLTLSATDADADALSFQLVSLPAFFVLRTVNAVFFLSAVWSELVMGRGFHRYEKGH